jgi:hypothetical protein
MHSNPWFRSHDGWWYFYCREGGKRRPFTLVQGKANRDAAYEPWHKLCRRPEAPRETTSDSAVSYLDIYLDWVQKNRSAGTYGNCLLLPPAFASRTGPGLTLQELKPKHVTAWLDRYS